MKIADTSRFAFKEALFHANTRAHQDPSDSANLTRVLVYSKALIRAFQPDTYGHTKFDLLIAGPDRLVNIILAYRAVLAGNTVAIYGGNSSDWVGYEALFEHRYQQFSPMASDLISESLGITSRGKKSEDIILNIALSADKLAATHNGEIVQLDGCELVLASDNADAGLSRFTVYPRAQKFIYPALERLMFWDNPDALPDDDWMAEHAISFKNVWLTGHHNNWGGAMGSKALRYADALRPLTGFDSFNGHERLRDIVEALEH